MTHTKDEALKLALEALTRYVNEDDICEGMPGNEPWVETKYMGEAAITAIKQALAAPVQEQIERAKQIWREDQQRIAELSAEIDRLTAAQPAPEKGQP
jgi:predicted NAD/FAD-dependent oxidoreductase